MLWGHLGYIPCAPQSGNQVEHLEPRIRIIRVIAIICYEAVLNLSLGYFNQLCVYKYAAFARYENNNGNDGQ